MNTKKRTIIALILCAVLTVAAAMPALALSGSVNHNINNYSLGIKQSCTGHFNASTARSTITLTFLPNYPHGTPDDYWCYTIMELHEKLADHSYQPLGGHMSCDTGTKNTTTMTITAAEFYYDVNDVEIYYETF
ncbi:MAG: hypothetical protein J5544_06885 [Clostridia bacterium]|nr:hypothetical protein [Clostridia bacterium]